MNKPNPKKITKNFWWSEMASKDGKDVPCRYQGHARELCESMEILRAEFGKSITVVSGWRSAAHNRRVGGRPRSQHLKGKAMDFRIDGVPHEVVYRTLLRLIREGKMRQGGAGLYPRRRSNTGKGGRLGFIHYDIRGKQARWRG